MLKSLTTPLALLLCAAAAAATLEAAEPIEALQAQLQQLALEVKTLKLELYRVSLQQIASDAAPLQRELQWLQTRLAKLAADDQAARERITAVQQQWSEDGLSPEERREMGQFENGRAAAETTRLAAERERLQRRESEITQHLQRQSQAWNAISAAVTTLETELSKTTRAPVPAR